MGYSLKNFVGGDSDTVKAIYALHKKRGDAEPRRGYLGASILGHPCERYLWFLFRNACREDFHGRLYRLFQTGDLEEARFIEELRGIGCEVHDHDKNGDQFEVNEFGGHLSGHMDGCAIGIPEAPKTWHVLEFKTHNKKSFTKLVAEGVERSKPMHFAQMQLYMHLTGMKRALYLAKNKDTDELYSERVKHDKVYCGCLLEKAYRIITSSTPAERISDNRDSWHCRWCSAKGLCHPTGDIPVLPVYELSCRQCCHSAAETEGKLAGKWLCDLGMRLDPNSQLEFPKTCPHFIVNPSFFNAEVVCSVKIDGNDCIKLNVDGTEIVHGCGDEMWHARALKAVSRKTAGTEIVNDAVKLFGTEPL